MPQQTFGVTGLHCQSCVRAITEVIMAIAGVTAVDVDLSVDGASAIRIDSESGLTAKQVQAAISEEGDYSVVS